jgi:hypothetical protein
VMHLPVGKLVNIQSRSELQVVTDILHLQNQKIVTYKGDYDTFERTRDERIRNQMKAHEANERTRGHIQVRFNSTVSFEFIDIILLRQHQIPQMYVMKPMHAIISA